MAQIARGIVDTEDVPPRPRKPSALPEFTKKAMRSRVEEAIQMYEAGAPLGIMVSGSVTSTTREPDLDFRFVIDERYP